MKRVFLTADPTDIEGRDLELVRRAAVALAVYATDGQRGRIVGDPVHEEVTEGRRRLFEDAQRAGFAWAQPPHTYSSCGDLVHWLLRCLGVRDERLVNRDDDGGDHPWKSGVNLSRLEASPYVVKGYGQAARPFPGDALFLSNMWGGHVCVLREWHENGQLAAPTGHALSGDYGQPYGRERDRVISRAGAKLALDGYPVEWWLSLELLLPLLVESASVPDDFKGGVVDGNPYPEPGVPLDTADTEPPPP